MMDVSIIIPIFNTEEYLTESLESVRKNTEQLKAEVFLIDDGSTDGSTEIAKGLSITGLKIPVPAVPVTLRFQWHQENICILWMPTMFWLTVFFSKCSD